MLDQIRSLHFDPGTQFSYANTNFYILGRLIEEVTGCSIGELLKERLFTPSGMATAELCEDNSDLPPPCVGYEGTEETGFFPARLTHQWSGDAGVVATLDDMIAYEQYLHKSWTDNSSIYREIAEPQYFKNREPASYGNGLLRVDVAGVATIGHGGAVRGFRLARLHAPEEGISVVTLFNHEADAESAAEYILKTVLGLSEPKARSIEPHPGWNGSFLDKVTNMAIQVKLGAKGSVDMNYGGVNQTLFLVDPIQAKSRSTSAVIAGDFLTLKNVDDNRAFSAWRIHSDATSPMKQDFAGQYYHPELDSTFHCEGSGSMLYGSFDGILGKGPAYIMRYLGEDIWVLKTRRGLDAPAPGDWTLSFSRSKRGAITGVTIGCWLARKLEFIRYDGTAFG